MSLFQKIVVTLTMFAAIVGSDHLSAMKRPRPAGSESEEQSGSDQQIPVRRSERIATKYGKDGMTPLLKKMRGAGQNPSSYSASAEDESMSEDDSEKTPDVQVEQIQAQSDREAENIALGAEVEILSVLNIETSKDTQMANDSRGSDSSSEEDSQNKKINQDDDKTLDDVMIEQSFVGNPAFGQGRDANNGRAEIAQDDDMGIKKPKKILNQSPPITVSLRPKKDTSFMCSLKNNTRGVVYAAGALVTAASSYGFSLSGFVGDQLSAWIEFSSYVIGGLAVTLPTVYGIYRWFMPMNTDADLWHAQALRLEKDLKLLTTSINPSREDLRKNLKETISFFQAMKESIAVTDTTQSLGSSLERQNVLKAKSLEKQRDWLRQECEFRMARMQLLDLNHKLALDDLKNRGQQCAQSMTQELDLKKNFNKAQEDEQAAYKSVLDDLINAEIVYHEAVLAAIEQ